MKQHINKTPTIPCRISFITSKALCTNVQPLKMFSQSGCIAIKDVVLANTENTLFIKHIMWFPWTTIIFDFVPWFRVIGGEYSLDKTYWNGQKIKLKCLLEYYILSFAVYSFVRSNLDCCSDWIEYLKRQRKL